jgi:hypothetical protein
MLEPDECFCQAAVLLVEHRFDVPSASHTRSCTDACLLAASTVQYCAGKPMQMQMQQAQDCVSEAVFIWVHLPFVPALPYMPCTLPSLVMHDMAAQLLPQLHHHAAVRRDIYSSTFSATYSTTVHHCVSCAPMQGAAWQRPALLLPSARGP